MGVNDIDHARTLLQLAKKGFGNNNNNNNNSNHNNNNNNNNNNYNVKKVFIALEFCSENQFLGPRNFQTNDMLQVK